MPGLPVVKSRNSTLTAGSPAFYFNQILIGDVMSNIYRDYWATTGDPSRSPRAGFQTVWVQKQLIKFAAREDALRAQYIRPTDLF